MAFELTIQNEQPKFELEIVEEGILYDLLISPVLQEEIALELNVLGYLPVNLNLDGGIIN